MAVDGWYAKIKKVTNDGLVYFDIYYNEEKKVSHILVSGNTELEIKDRIKDKVKEYKNRYKEYSTIHEGDIIELGED